MRCGWSLSVVVLLLVACGSPEPRREASPRPVPECRLRLAPGTAAEEELAGDGSRVYLFDLEAGQYAGLTVDQEGIDVAVTLTAPDGRRLAAVDSPNGTEGPEPVPVVADASGPYRLEVRSLDPKAGPGRYRLRVEGLRPATPADRTRVSAERLLATGDVAGVSTAVPLFHSLGDRSREADALDVLGDLLWGRGDKAEAARAYERAASLFRQTGRRKELADALNGLGIARVALGRTEEARGAYREALAVSRALGDRAREAATLTNLGRLETALGEAESALEAHERSLALWRELGDRGQEGWALVNLGRSAAALGDDRRAIEGFTAGLPLLEAAGRQREAAGVLGELGLLLGRSGREREGIDRLERALALQRSLGNRTGEAVALSDLGNLLEGSGRREEARRHYARALALLEESGDRLRQPMVLLCLARLENDPRAAADLIARALRFAEEAGNREAQAQALDDLARIRRREGDLRGALAAVENALGRIEALREEPESPADRASFLATKQRTYGLAIALLMELGEDRQAFEANERSRARSLLDILAGREARPVSLDEVQRELLDGDSVLLQYALGEERSVLWAVTPETFETFELPPRKVLEEAARSAHALLAASHQTLARARTAQALDELSRLLLEPVAGRLEGRRLVIVGDGALLALPFGALPAAAGHEVVTLPSVSSLAALRRKTAGRPPAPATLVVVADPVFGGRLPPLPFSREEARTLLALVPAEERLAILGLAANRETVTGRRLARYRIVHFATHGVLDAEHPERSGIALSDGFLRAGEIDRLSLPADLVVLSACETALGREIRGEGLVGLPRAFLHAGARRVLVSLWPVEDRATAELMRRFYREMLDQDRPPAAALRAAQTSLAKEPGWGAPYYWAGFVLQGDWR